MRAVHHARNAGWAVKTSCRRAVSLRLCSADMGRNSIGDAGDWVAKGKWYPGEKQMRAARIKAHSAPKGADPLWCVVCRKRFGSQGVFDSHLTGKKHIGALRAAGRAEEAEAMKQRVVSERNRAELAKAQEQAKAKRSRPAARPDDVSERDKKVAKACFEAGFQRQGQRAGADIAPDDTATAAPLVPTSPGGAAKSEPTSSTSQHSQPNPNGLE